MYFLKYNDLELNVKMIVHFLLDNLLEFNLDKPVPFDEFKEASGPFKDMLKLFDPFKTAMASVAFKEDKLEASTSFKDYNQEISIPFKIIAVASIPLAFKFLVEENHTASLTMVELLGNNNLKEWPHRQYLELNFMKHLHNRHLLLVHHGCFRY